MIKQQVLGVVVDPTRLIYKRMCTMWPIRYKIRQVSEEFGVLVGLLRLEF